MTTPTRPATIDPAILNDTVKGFQFRYLSDELPDAVSDAASAAVEAYIRGRRDTKAARAVLSKRLPAILSSLVAYVEENLRDYIAWNTNDLQELRANPNPSPLQLEETAHYEKKRRDLTALRQWLSGGKSRRRP